MKLSLFYPESEVNCPKNILINEESLKDLEVPIILRELNLPTDSSLNSFASASSEVISYRNNIIDDILNDDTLFDFLIQICPIIETISNINLNKNQINREPVFYLEVYNEISVFIKSVDSIQEFLVNHRLNLKSAALDQFFKSISYYAHTPEFINLKNNIDNLEVFTYPKSVTVAFNLDEQLKPFEAGIVNINNYYYKSGNIIDRLLRFDFKKDDTCISTLTLTNPKNDISAININNSILNFLNRYYEKGLYNIADVVKKYIKSESDILFDIKELLFYISAVKFIKKIRALGLPMCKPIVSEKQERIMEIENTYNVSLALTKGKDIVMNDAEFNESGRIFILTGPNQGGKTVHAQALGTAQLLSTGLICARLERKNKSGG